MHIAAWRDGGAAVAPRGGLLVPKTKLWPEDVGWKSPEQLEQESHDAAA
jgi:hypothetical protein